jgi:XTP/dITP diphosphohydrolase
MTSFDDLVALCKKSTAKDPWVKDRGLAGYCEEIAGEAEEALQAIKNNDNANLREELGDVLLDWCHACILAEQEERCNMQDVIEGVMHKLAARKPYLHETRTITREESDRAWKRAKLKHTSPHREEEHGKTS